MVKLTKPMNLSRLRLGYSDKFGENTLQLKVDFH